jgi:alanine racemase
VTGVTLRLNTDTWREHIDAVARATPGLVPVIKGNGYGFGHARLAREAARLDTDTIAVGVAGEVAEVAGDSGQDVVILQPYRTGDPVADKLLADDRVIFTVSSLADLAGLAADPRRPRVLIEIRTSMRRHGILADDLLEVAGYLDQVRFEGWALHLPLADYGRYAEAELLARTACQVSQATLWVSHLPPADAGRLARQLGDVAVRLRVGTNLWLGETASRRSVAEVLDVHSVRRGDRIGYRQRRMPADGSVLVMAGGTAHGIGMEAPTAAASLRQRAISVITGSLNAAGFALSPYEIGGKKRWFCEPPHMQASMIFLPHGQQRPAIGDEVPVELRLTTATVDHIVETSDCGP